MCSSDLHLPEAELEQRRKDLLEQARELSEQKRQFDITLREYNIAHDFTPARDAPRGMKMDNLARKDRLITAMQHSVQKEESKIRIQT